MQRPDLQAAGPPRGGRPAAQHLPQEQADPTHSGASGPAAQAQHPRLHGLRGGRRCRHYLRRRRAGEGRGRETPRHKVPPETSAGPTGGRGGLGPARVAGVAAAGRACLCTRRGWRRRGGDSSRPQLNRRKGGA